ncbi:universal stress protein [Streptomyces sp. NPDC086787]|uniref:universal stress protein n=1 Tax=Streptomyces sp. NPDC086787 TaxID=3365759 RepID=UPI00382EB244
MTGVLRPWRREYPNVPMAATVAEGRGAVVLIRAARDAGLLVVGRRGIEHQIGVHAGPVTHAALHHVGCAVAVVPHD